MANQIIMLGKSATARRISKQEQTSILQLRSPHAYPQFGDPTVLHTGPTFESVAGITRTPGQYSAYGQLRGWSDDSGAAESDDDQRMLFARRYNASDFGWDSFLGGYRIAASYSTDHGIGKGCFLAFSQHGDSPMTDLDDLPDSVRSLLTRGYNPIPSGLAGSTETPEIYQDAYGDLRMLMHPMQADYVAGQTTVGFKHGGTTGDLTDFDDWFWKQSSDSDSLINDQAILRKPLNLRNCAEWREGMDIAEGGYVRVPDQHTGSVIWKIVDDNSQSVSGTEPTWFAAGYTDPNAYDETDDTYDVTDGNGVVYRPVIRLRTSHKSFHNGYQRVFRFGNDYYSMGFHSGASGLWRSKDGVEPFELVDVRIYGDSEFLDDTMLEAGYTYLHPSELFTWNGVLYALGACRTQMQNDTPNSTTGIIGIWPVNPNRWIEPIGRARTIIEPTGTAPFRDFVGWTPTLFRDAVTQQVYVDFTGGRWVTPSDPEYDVDWGDSQDPATDNSNEYNRLQSVMGTVKMLGVEQ